MGFRMFLASRTSRIVVEVLSALTVLSIQPYRPIVFMGSSMAPTYADMELAIASTEVGSVVSGDVVVIKRDEGSIVKRVEYVAGNTIDYYRVAGEWIFGLEANFEKELLNNRFPRLQVRIPKGYVFVLGDNRPESLDSREFGLVPVSAITAKLLHSRPRVPMNNENHIP